MLKSLIQAGIVLVIAASALGGCSDAKNTITCSDVCNRYQDCFDEDYDVSSCVDRCKSRAGSDDDKQSQLNQCDACIDDKSCTAAAFSCATECVSIVP
jgi:hypothetical protein